MKVRYFCDGCGAAVGARADRCPACGKYFSAVRCPSCSYQGKVGEFARGCPVCGYLADSEGAGGSRSPAAPPARREPRLSRAAALSAGAALLALLIVLVVVLLRR
jgi:hypothetical protein